MHLSGDLGRGLLREVICKKLEISIVSVCSFWSLKHNIWIGISSLICVSFWTQCLRGWVYSWKKMVDFQNPSDREDCQTQNRTFGDLSDTRGPGDALLWNSNSKRATFPFPLKSLDLLPLLLVVVTVTLTWKSSYKLLCSSYKTCLMTSETWHFICWKYGFFAVHSSCSSVAKFLLQVSVNLFSWMILSQSVTFTCKTADCARLQSTPTSP